MYVSVSLVVLGVSTSVVVFLLVLTALLRFKRRKGAVAFLHPFCDGGGGGERVLWCAVDGLLERRPDLDVWIYSASASAPAKICAGVETRFGFKVDASRITFISLSSLSMCLINAGTWRAFTVLGQSLGSMVLGLEALFRRTPEYFVDTMGLAFTFPAARWFAGCTVVAYVHYPTMSRDMLKRVRDRQAMYNNAGTVAASPVLTAAKTFYYIVFLRIYGLAGKQAAVVFANSTWTKARVDDVWHLDENVPVRLLYPPADLSLFRPKQRINRENLIVSVAQFRPEKNHRLQLEAFHLAIQESGAEGSMAVGSLPPDTRLVLLGGVRNADDEALVQGLRAEAKRLGVENQIEFQLNLPLPELIRWLHRARCAVHTMVDEHFGISLLEFLAADLVVVAHDSGGPREDILRPFEGGEVGILANTAAEYALGMCRAVCNYDEGGALGCKELRTRADRSMARFVDNDAFSKRFVEESF